MKYVRTFILQSTHFNGAPVYEARENHAKAWVTGNYKRAAELALAMAVGQHGHNFVITVEVTGEPVDGFLIDDELLEKTVRQWDRCNLSLHEDFSGIRATTEEMALGLVGKVRALAPGTTVRVRVLETPDIYAEASK